MTYEKTKTKSKRKRSDSPAWLDSLLGPVYLDFVAPFPLETCLNLLKNQETSGFFRFRKIKVDLNPEDADTVGFHYKKWGYKYSTIEADGQFERWKNRTLVTARVNIAPVYYLMILFSYVILIAIMGFFLVRVPWVLLLFGAMLAVNWYFMRQRLREIAQQIETALMVDLDDESIF